MTQPATSPTPELLADLRRDEGLNLSAYPDPLSKGPPWTIGYGHTGPKVAKGQSITQDYAEQLLVFDATAALIGCTKVWPWFPGLNPVRQDALANMAFNLGLHKLQSFNTFLGLMASGHWQAAAADLEQTAWYKEVGDRAVRIAHMIATGARP